MPFLPNQYTQGQGLFGRVGDFVSQRFESAGAGLREDGNGVLDLLFRPPSETIKPEDFETRNASLGEENSNPETAINTSVESTIGVGNLTYPPDPAPYHMVFEFAKYERPNPKQQSKLQPVQTIIMPMPDGSGINDHQSFGWNTAPMGIVGLGYENLAALGTTVGDVANASGLGDKSRALMKQGGDVGAYLASSALQSVGGGIGSNLATLGGQVIGAVVNPGMSTFFDGIRFRNFSFTWTFAPKDETESLLIRRIINAFKVNSLPTFSSTSAIFNYPLIVKPKYSLNSDPDNTGYITDFRYCAITDISVKYSPQGEAPSFYSGTHAPVFINCTIALQEIEYQLADSYKGERSGRVLGADVTATIDGVTKSLGVNLNLNSTPTPPATKTTVPPAFFPSPLTAPLTQLDAGEIINYIKSFTPNG
jgi:hypothetical protein